MLAEIYQSTQPRPLEPTHVDKKKQPMMHPRNRYSRTPADFGELAKFRPSLEPFLIEKNKRAESVDASSSITPSSSKTTPTATLPGTPFKYTLNFSDPAAVRELTCAVLEKDFGLKVEIPLDKLIPTVPQKLNYIHWIEDLLSCGGVARSGEAKTEEEGLGDEEVVIPKGSDVIGIDIGTGASCIYPLLGSFLNGWSFIATDVTVDTIKYATENISRNDMLDNIKVKLVSDEVMLKEILDPSVKQYSFTMCNPPFFASEKERFGELGSHSGQRPSPSTFSSGTTKEVVTEGGEVGFIQKIIRDSLELKDRIKWYTSMVGKKADLKEITLELTSQQIPVVATTEFVQGKTWRWGVAWSFDPTLKDKVEVMTKKRTRKRRRSQASLQMEVQGAGNSVPCPSPQGIQSVWEWLREEFKRLEIDRTVERGVPCDMGEDSVGGGVCDRIMVKCRAGKVTWTHQRKKRRLQEKLESHRLSEETEGEHGGKSHGLSFDELQRQTEEEIEVLCVPCNIEFICCIKLEEAAASASTKRKKKKGTCSKRETEASKEVVVLELELVQGDESRDSLHQIMQYIQNRMSLKSFH